MQQLDALHGGTHVLASDIAAALDPVVFAQRAGLDPAPWQATVLRSPADQQILLCSRQSGKSTTAATLAVHTAVYEPDSLILVLSPSLRQSSELFRKMMEIFSAAGQHKMAVVENKLTLELANGSRVVSLPGKEATIRGFSSVSKLIVDEASRVADDLYQAIRPMLMASAGGIVLLSTPFGKRGFFYHEWTHGGLEWHRTKITAYDVPHFNPERIEAERRKIPASVFDQEYLCVFGELEDAAFAHDDIHAAVRDDLAPLILPGASL